MHHVGIIVCLVTPSKLAIFLTVEEYQYVQNYKVLQACFNAQKISKVIANIMFVDEIITEHFSSTWRFKSLSKASFRRTSNFFSG